MKRAGGKVVFDIDYRPNLWGLAGHAAGDNRYIASETVSNHLKTVLPDCDLIVGTEEEVLIASGESELLQALKHGRLEAKGENVEPELHRRRDLVDVLPAGAGGGDEVLLRQRQGAEGQLIHCR